MVTLVFFINAARAEGVVLVDALPQMMTVEMVSPPASTTSPDAGPTNVRYPASVTNMADANVQFRVTVVKGGSAIGKITACIFVYPEYAQHRSP